MQWQSTATAEKPRKQPRRQHHNSGAMLNVSEVRREDNEFASHLLELNGACGVLWHVTLSSASWTASNTVQPHNPICHRTIFSSVF